MVLLLTIVLVTVTHSILKELIEEISLFSAVALIKIEICGFSY